MNMSWSSSELKIFNPIPQGQKSFGEHAGGGDSAHPQ